MKRKFFVFVSALVVVALIAFVGCNIPGPGTTISHKGVVSKTMSIVITDSVKLQMDSTGSKGNFFIWNG